MLTLLLSLALADPARAAAPESPPAAPAVAPEVITRYDAVRVALAGDNLDGARAAARDLATASVNDPVLASAATHLAETTDATAARTAFSEASRVLVTRLATTMPTPKVVVFYCPMWTAGYPWWVQPKSGIVNPYMGAAMPDCGEERSLKAAAKAAAVPR